MCDPRQVADGANMIVNGYAFTFIDGGRVSVLNLNEPNAAAVLAESGELLETTMDDIEVAIVVGYYLDNREFMEVRRA